MQKLKNLIFLVSVMLLVFGSSFSSFAMVPLNFDQLEYFEDGPWTTVRCGFYSVNENGTYARMAVPSWRDGSGAGTNYYSFTNNNRPYTDIYMFADHYNYNFAIVADAPLLELYLHDHDGVWLSSVLDDAFLGEKDGKYYYGISMVGCCGFGLRGSGTIIMTEYSPAFDGGSEYDNIQSLLPIVSGVYDGNSVAVRYPGMSWNAYIENPLSRTASYGTIDALFPLTIDQCWYDGALVTFKFNESTGFLRDGSTYDFVFEVFNGESVRMSIGDSSEYTEASVVHDSVNLTTIGNGSSLSDLKLGIIYNNNYSDRTCHAVAFKYVSSMSDDIGTVPPDDDDGGGGSSGSPDYSAAIGQIGSTLKELLSSQDSSTTTIVNNITNATTTISNTITNTTQQITNTITNGVSSITNSLQSVEQGISNKLGEVQDGLSNKLQEVEEGINTQLKDTTDEIVNGYDSSSIDDHQAALDSSLQEYDQAEQNVLDNVNDSLNSFEFDSGMDEYKTSIQVFSDFLQALYESAGAFKIVINLSLMLSVAGIVIGLYRFKDGG